MQELGDRVRKSLEAARLPEVLEAVSTALDGVSDEMAPVAASARAVIAYLDDLLAGQYEGAFTEIGENLTQLLAALLELGAERLRFGEERANRIRHALIDAWTAQARAFFDYAEELERSQRRDALMAQYHAAPLPAN
ncbi:MAG TPA: hypothetical protein PLP17_01480 [Oligoflexia bacterium]|nr:hypothetical protein [Oligoflexia bacterium]